MRIQILVCQIGANTLFPAKSHRRSKHTKKKIILLPIVYRYIMEDNQHSYLYHPTFLSIQSCKYLYKYIYGTRHATVIHKQGEYTVNILNLYCIGLCVQEHFHTQTARVPA